MTNNTSTLSRLIQKLLFVLLSLVLVNTAHAQTKEVNIEDFMGRYVMIYKSSDIGRYEIILLRNNERLTGQVNLYSDTKGTILQNQYLLEQRFSKATHSRITEKYKFYRYYNNPSVEIRFYLVGEDRFITVNLTKEGQKKPKYTITVEGPGYTERRKGFKKIRDVESEKYIAIKNKFKFTDIRLNFDFV